jgi:hypothetical protein
MQVAAGAHFVVYYILHLKYVHLNTQSISADLVEHMTARDILTPNMTHTTYSGRYKLQHAVIATWHQLVHYHNNTAAFKDLFPPNSHYKTLCKLVSYHVFIIWEIYIVLLHLFSSY